MNRPSEPTSRPQPPTGATEPASATGQPPATERVPQPPATHASRGSSEAPSTAEASCQSGSAEPAALTLADFQELIRRMYLEKDLARGVDGTFMWLVEEIGELAAALRDGSHQDRLEEFADVLAWLATIANSVGVDLTEAIQQKYGSGCPGCGQFVCQCADTEKP